LRLIIGNDGLPECKSSSISLDVVSCQFEGCKTVFPWKILRPQPGFKFSANDFFGPCVQEIISENIKVLFLVLDSPKRAFLRCQKSHAGYYGYDFCYAKGEHLGSIVYGSQSIHAPLRNHKDAEKLAESAENNEDVNLFGIKGN
jgi:hypothetical protein